MADAISENYRNMRYLTELDLKDLLLQVGRGLKYIHSMALVHMDIKPSESPAAPFFSIDLHSAQFKLMRFVFLVLFLGNIFISRTVIPNSSIEEVDDEDCGPKKVVYKIGEVFPT